MLGRYHGACVVDSSLYILTNTSVKPVSATRGGLDASGASALARISVMISMPFSGPFKAPEPLPDDEMYLPYLEMGLSDADVLLMDEDVLRSDSNEGSKKKG